MDPKLMCRWGLLALLMPLAATGQDIVIKPKDPAAAEAKILEIFESQLETHPEFLTELLAENRDGAERLLRAAQKKRPTARPWALDVQTLFAADVFAGGEVRPPGLPL